MWSVIICNSNEVEREQLLKYVRKYFSKKGLELSVLGVSDWPALFENLKKAEPDIIIVAQNGVPGLDIITSAHLSPQKFIWFSDLDFALQAYRLCLSWFSKKPVSYQKMERALSRCMEEVI